MAEAKPKVWTDTEKFGLLIQIVEKAGSVPWDDLALPEGRTKKACMVMLDREKQKVKKATTDNTTSLSGKRDAEATDDEGEPKAKAKKKARTKKTAVQAEAIEEIEENGGSDD